LGRLHKMICITYDLLIIYKIIIKMIFNAPHGQGRVMTDVLPPPLLSSDICILVYPM